MFLEFFSSYATSEVFPIDEYIDKIMNVNEHIVWKGIR